MKNILIILLCLLSIGCNRKTDQSMDDQRAVDPSVTDKSVTDQDNVESSETDSDDYYVMPLTEKELIGIWQYGTPTMAAKWSDTFAFFPDGKIIHRPHQACDAREISKTGEWHLEGHELIVKLKIREHLVGGELVEKGGSCVSGYMIEGGHLEYDDIIPAKNLRYPISDIEVEEEYIYIVTIGEDYYFKMRDDPEDYY